MKRLVVGLLLAATALAPIAAQAQVRERTREDIADSGPDRVRVRETRPERQEQREQRQERRAERQAERRAERAEAGGVDRPRRDRDETRPNRRFDGDGARSARPDRIIERRAGQVFPRSPEQRRERREDRRDRIEDRRDFREDRRYDRQDARRDRRDDWRTDRREWWDDPRDNGGSGWGRDAYRSGQVWNRGWRNDRRYDWDNYRQYNRTLYRLPRYYAPGGYGYQYRRFGLGAILSRSLFDQTYWLDDPYSYRLPPAYGPYRWVRYYGDALLVDLRTGRVIDVVHDIFY